MHSFEFVGYICIGMANWLPNERTLHLSIVYHMGNFLSREIENLCMPKRVVNPCRLYL